MALPRSYLLDLEKRRKVSEKGKREAGLAELAAFAELARATSRRLVYARLIRGELKWTGLICAVSLPPRTDRIDLVLKGHDFSRADKSKRIEGF